MCQGQDGRDSGFGRLLRRKGEKRHEHNFLMAQ